MWRAVVLLAAVFGLKLVVLLQLKDHPLLQPEAGLDTTAYVQLAERVLTGDLGLGPGLYYVSPFYIYFLAAALAVFDSFTAVRVVQILLGTASVGLIFLTARSWFGGRAGWIAAGLAALTGLFTFYEVVILQSSIDAFLTSAGLFTLTGGLAAARPDGELGRRRDTWLLAAGVIFGLAALNRPNMPFGVAAICLALAATRKWRAAVLLSVGLLAGMAPAAIRNVVVAQQWSFVSSHGGLNFYIGNGEGATGFYRLIPGVSPTIGGQEKDVRRVAAAAAGRPLTDAETSDYFFGLAWKGIRANPGYAVALFARKLGYVFSSAHVALPHSYPFYAYDEHTMLRFYAIGPWLLVPLGLVGLAFAMPRTTRRDYLVWASFVPGYAIGVAAFFIAERYRLPLLVPLCIGAGAAVDSAIRAIESKDARRLWMTGCAFVALLVFVNWPLGLHDGRWEEGLRTAQRLIILRQYEAADARVRAFEPRGPYPGATHYGAGAQLIVENQPERALPHLMRAQEVGGGRPEIAYALGQALLKTGRAQEAIPHLRRGFDAGIALPLGGYDLAVALLTTGDHAGAVETIKRIGLPDDESDVEAWLRLGRLAARARAPDVADGYFGRAVQMRPDLAAARQQHGLNLLVLRRFDDAAPELAAAVRLDPRDPDSLAHLAYCEIQLGKTADAIGHIQAALALDRQHLLANQLMAALQHQRR